MRIGIAGLGFGAAVHLPVFQSLPGVEVVALAATRHSKAQEIASRHGVPHACTEIDELLALDLDAVSLAVPPSVTERAAAVALRRGLAVLAEKPLASSAAAADALAAQARGRTAMVDFQFAELESVRALKRALDEQVAGPVRFANIVWLSQSWSHSHARWSWKTDARADGGVMAMLGSHSLFLVEHLLGRIASLEARFDRRATSAFAPAGEEPAEDTAFLQLGLENGVPVTLTVSNSAPGGHAHRWEIVCRDGTLELVNEAADAVSGFVLVLRDLSGARKVLAREVEAETETGDTRRVPFRRLASRFVEAAAGRAACWPDFASAARVQHLLGAAAVAAHAWAPKSV